MTNAQSSLRTKAEDLKMGKINEERILQIWRAKMGSRWRQFEDQYSNNDFFDDNGDHMEHKSRRITKNRYDTALMPKHKADGEYRNLYFTYTYLDGFYYIKYDKELFSTFKVKPMKVYRDGKYDKEQLCFEIPNNLLINIDTLPDMEVRIDILQRHYNASMGDDCDIWALEESMKNQIKKIQ
jgi:hypothetical protein